MMSPLLSYMTEKRRLLANGYEANCLTIARDIARLLLDAGCRPFILSLSKTEDMNGNRFHYPLMPKRYGGCVTWTKHYVCCLDGMAFDPILDCPVPIDVYSRTVFGEDFPVERFVSEEAMREYLRQRFVPDKSIC